MISIVPMEKEQRRTNSMGIPQIIIIIILGLNLGINLAKNGEPREGDYNFVIAFIGAAIEAGLLYWGGFFS